MYKYYIPINISLLSNIIFSGLKGNPLSQDLLAIYNESNGTQKLLSYMLDNLQGKCSCTGFIL